MALQRRNKKSQKGELTCPQSRVGPSAPGEGVQPQDTSGLMSPDSGGVREESDNMPQRFQDADGKTYALLQDATIHEKPLGEEGTLGPFRTPDLKRKPPPAGIEDMEGTQLGPAKHCTRAQDWAFGMNPSKFPTELLINFFIKESIIILLN